MRDDLVSRIKAEQPDTCVQDALTFAADEFFTDTSPAVLGRSLAVAEDLSERGLKISCRKCKKFIDRVIGTIVSSPILTPLVCGQIAAGVTAATTPVGGSIAGFVCLDQAERERRKLAAKGKVEQLRVSVGRFKPGMPKVEMRPESLAK
jgi:TRAP-type mannitol/chloroaromatic compound transport system permease large subunit